MSRASHGARGRYELLERIGVGGMGSVYRARHVFTGEVGALKLLHAHRGSDERSVLRFLREARTVSLAKSPHIVQVKDAGGMTSKRPFIFMELLQGVTLKRLLVQEGRLAPALVAEFAQQVASGLETAHRAGIVHRDIKPDNLFLVTEGASELPLLKLLDFGISKLDAALDERTALTRQGAPLGTPGYMAPEQFYDSANVDRQADVYALGVVVYQCLSGRLPFVAATMREQCEAAHRADLPLLAEVPAELQSPLHRILQRALSVRPEQRHAGCAELSAALFEVIGSEVGARAEWQALRPQLAVGSSSPYVRSEHGASYVGSTGGGDGLEAASASGEDLAAATQGVDGLAQGTTVVPWISWDDLPAHEAMPVDAVPPADAVLPPDATPTPAQGHSVPTSAVQDGRRSRHRVWSRIALGGLALACLGLVVTKLQQSPPASGIDVAPSRVASDAAEVAKGTGEPVAVPSTVPASAAAAPSNAPPPAVASTKVRPAKPTQRVSANVAELRPRQASVPSRSTSRAQSEATALSASQQPKPPQTDVVEGRYGTRFVREFE